VHDRWSKFLAARGAQIEQDAVLSFGDRRAELDAVASGAVLADLSHFGVLAVDGDDARTFLQAQLSCDVLGLADDRATYGSYCSPQGRVLANFLLWRDPSAVQLLMPLALLDGVASRLKKFILRAKVNLRDRRADVVVFGIAGASALDAVVPLAGSLHVARRGALTAIALSASRVLVVASPAEAESVWARLAAAFRPVGSDCWHWLDIVAGVPWIGPATQDEFVPQMANLELLGAVSFDKGCYPGQEIVARSQYRGKVKRRLALAHVDGERAPLAGDALLASDDAPDQAAGQVVNAAPAPGGGFDLLAVVHTGRVGAPIHLGSVSGPRLAFRPLPYTVP
jgi:folate-binding protein YgfZ